MAISVASGLAALGAAAIIRKTIIYVGTRMGNKKARQVVLKNKRRKQG